MPVMTCALVERLQTITDPRRHCENRKHPLVDIVILGFCGVLGGGDDFVEIAEWAKVKEGFFRLFLELPHGIPAHDTCNRVFAMLKPSTVQAVLLPWLLERRTLPASLRDNGTVMRLVSSLIATSQRREGFYDYAPSRRRTALRGAAV